MIETLTSKEHRAMQPLLDFYSNDANFKQFLDVVVHKNRNLPLRLLDWFVTNYVKKNDVHYQIKRPNGSIEVFKVYRSYRAQLKGAKKQKFDPFCRGVTVTLEYEPPNGDSSQTKLNFETALCQLKFFRWAIENLVLDYVEANYNDIYEDMIKNNSGSKIKPEDKSEIIDEHLFDRKRKTELSKSVYQTICVSSSSITLNMKKSPLICV